MLTVVTGAAGHVGANLVRALVAEGRAVRAVVHRDRRALAGLPVEVVQADVTDPASLRAAFQGARRAFHLAAVISISGDRGGRVQRVNVEGARNVAEAALAAGVERLVHCSSIHAFRIYGAARVDEATPRADPSQGAYDRSKAAGEQALRAVMARGLDAVIVHPTGVIGPYDFGPSRMGRVLLDLAHRRLPALVDGGFDWVDARDVAKGLLAAEARGRAGGNYLLSGRWHAMAEVAALAEAVTGVRPPRLCTPRWLALAGVPFAALAGALAGREPLYTAESLRALGACRQISSEKAARELGHRPRPLSETIADTCAWFAQEGLLPGPPRPRARTPGR